MKAEEIAAKEAVEAEAAKAEEEAEAKVQAEVAGPSEEESAAAALKIQCAARKRAARKAAVARREVREQQWEARAAAAEAEDAEAGDQFRTPEKGASKEGSAAATPEASPVAPVTEGDDTGADADQAAGVIQRGFRVHAAKKEADRRRAVAQEQLAEKRRQLELEEADMSL